jgi:hypothetical protein
VGTPEAAEMGILCEAKGEELDERERWVEELGLWVGLEVGLVAVVVALVEEEMGS